MKRNWNLTEDEIKRDVEIMGKLKAFDTPTITNVVATYPKDENCLGLYNPWYGNWYTDSTLKCMFPELGRLCGYVVTATYGLPDPNYSHGSNVGDVFDAIKESPQPVILCVKQDMPEEIKQKNGLLGGNMMTSFKRAGMIGAISDGPSRDVDEVRLLDVQYMLTGVTAGHGDFSLQAINDTVDICGMRVGPGDIIHMDENGAVKFPREYLEDVLVRAQSMHDAEEAAQKKLSQANSGKEIDDILKNKYK